MNVCVAHYQMYLCGAKNFGAWTENVGALSQISRIAYLQVAHCSLCNLNFGAWSEKFGHPCFSESERKIMTIRGKVKLVFGLNKTEYIYNFSCSFSISFQKSKFI